MPDSAVAITAGTGTSIDTRTEGTNGNHRQVVVLGDPATNAGVAPVDATAGLKVDLGADNDVTLATLPDTTANDLAEINTAVTSLDAKIVLGQALASAAIPVVLPATQITTLTPPAAISGFATSAKQDTIIGHVDGIEGLLTTIDADTSNLSVVGTGTEATAIRVTIATDSTGVLSVDDNGGSLTVDGTVAVTNAGITTIAGAVAGTEMQVDVLTMPTVTVNAHAVTNAGTFAVQSTNQTGDNTIGRVKLTDGTDVADILDLTNANPLTVAILDGDGTQITSFGGGTQYTESATDASITGTAMMMEGALDTLLPVQGTVADGLLVNLGANNDVTVSGVATSANQTTEIGHLADLAGTVTAARVQVDASTTNVAQSGAWTVTADAGTNLNTSALALEAGGNLAAIKAKTDNIPAQGQALAAASLPVVLTAAQVTTLTPPAAITGFATSAKQDTLLTELQLKADLTETQPVSLASVPSHAVTNAGTFAVQVDGNALTSLQLIDDTVATTASAIPTKGLAVSGTDGTNARVIKTDTSGELQVDVLTIPAIPAGTNNIGDVDVLTVNGVAPAFGTGARGATVQRVTIATDDVVPASQSGTWNIGTVTTLTGITNALPSGTNAIGKLAANSGVDIGDVTLTAGTAAIGTLLPPDIDVTTHTNYAKKYYTNAGAVTDGIVWSPAAGKRWHVGFMYINVSAAATVTLEDDLAGGDSPVWKAELAANSGIAVPFPSHYPLASAEDAADLIVTTTAGNVYITVVGYEI